MAFTWQDIKDMIVQFPNKFKIDGVTHTIEPDFGTITEPGTPINKALLQRYEDIISNQWELVVKYDVAGTYSFDPTSYGLTEDDELGAYIVGGGGSGAVAVWSASGTGNMYGSVTGGAAGRTKIGIFSPTLPSYPVVVGAGGAAVTITNTGANGINGNAGGSSSFNSLVAIGGEGGKSVTPSTSDVGAGLANGGQPSNMYSWARRVDYSHSPCMGEYRIQSSSFLPAYIASGDILNIFERKRYLSAGGAATVYINNTTPNSAFQTGSVTDAGGKGGNGVATGTYEAVATATGEAGSGAGNGGGGAVALCKAAASPASTATSGKGADGAVMIYKRRKAS